MQNFSELSLSPSLKERLLAGRFTTPTPVQAAAIPQAGMLAMQGLLARGPLRPGQTILINGAGGGVGTGGECTGLYGG